MGVQSAFVFLKPHAHTDKAKEVSKRQGFPANRVLCLWGPPLYPIKMHRNMYNMPVRIFALEEFSRSTSIHGGL